jgi:hypothetical protein
MNIGTMKIDTTFLTRPHAFVVYGLIVLACIVVFEPSLRNACVAIALVFVISMLTRVGQNCDRATRTIEFLNCGLCILLLIGVILK